MSKSRRDKFEDQLRALQTDINHLSHKLSVPVAYSTSSHSHSNLNSTTNSNSNLNLNSNLNSQVVATPLGTVSKKQNNGGVFCYIIITITIM